MKRFYAILASALLAAAAGAADGPGDFAKAQAELKARAPEDYAKIEKLASTDLTAALREFRAAAKKHGISLPRSQMRGSRYQGGDGDRPGRGPGRGDRPGRGFGRGMNFLGVLAVEGRIRKAFPQEFDAVIRELCAAEEKLEKLAERAGEKYPPNFNSQLRKLRTAAPEKMVEIGLMAADDPGAAFRALNELAREQGIELSMPGMRGRRGGERPGRGVPGRDGEEKSGPRRISYLPINKFREEFPDEMKRYDELREQDPAAAKKLLMELNERYQKRRTGR